MENHTLGKKILIIEDSETDYMDILKCLPKSLIPEHKPTINVNDIATLKNCDYVLCICDKLMDIKFIQNGYPLDSPLIFDAFIRGVKRISKLRRHLDCHLIVVTKVPIRYLRDHFNNLINVKDLDLEAIFDKDYINLPQKLNASKSLPFGVVYASKKVHIVIKPYSANSLSNDDVLKWRSDFTKLLKKLCL